MAIATLVLRTSPSPRHAAAASANRVPPRVYSPFGARRLARPMAIPVEAESGAAAGGRTRRSVFGGRRDIMVRDRSS